MVSSTVESYGCVHLILKDGTWVIVRLRRLPAATWFSLCFLFHVVHGHITHPLPLFFLTTITTLGLRLLFHFRIPSPRYLYFRYKLYTHSHRKPCVRYFEKLSNIFHTASILAFQLPALFQLYFSFSRISAALTPSAISF